jgi:pilus assembly protein CpaE
MKPKLSIVLLESDSVARNDISSVLKSFDANIGSFCAAASFQEGIRFIQSGEPGIVILEVKEVEQGVKETAFLVSRYPQTTVIVTASEKNPDWILRLIRAGASEYLTKPIVAEELKDAVRKVTRLHAHLAGPADNRGTVISVYNPSGGMGTTTIAVNLAASLAAQGKDVVLVDLNLCCGDITTFLDLAPRYTLSNVTARQGQIDANFLRSVIFQHSSGVHVLCGPTDLQDASTIRPEQLREIVAILQGLFSYIIIDTCGQLFGCNQAAFEISDKVLFVTVMALQALKNAKHYLAAMDKEGLGPDRVKLVINRHNPRDEIKVSEAERIMNTKAYMTVPNAYADVRTSINKGTPLVNTNPRSTVKGAIDDLARQLALDTAAGKNTVSMR